MGRIVDLVQQYTATTGTGPLTLGAAVPGFRTIAAAGIPDGTEVSYAIQDGTNRETDVGIVGGSGTTLTRGLRASSTGSLLNLTGNAVVGITANGGDFLEAYPSSNFSLREQSWYADANTGVHLFNGAIFSERWGIGISSVVTRIPITGSNGRFAFRSDATFSGGQLSMLQNSDGSAGQYAIANIDAGATWRWKQRVRLRPGAQPAPTATDDYYYQGGFNTFFNSFTTNNFATFAYYLSGGTVFFESRTRRAGGTIQATSLTLPTADQWQTLEIVLTSSQVLFYVDAVLVATHTTVPTGAIGDGFRHETAGAGTASRKFDFSFLALNVNWGADS